MNAVATVLVVDDEEVVRQSHLRVLGGAHCHVKAVDGGEQALREMEQQPFDLVLLDLRMPGVDGMSLLRTMKHRWPESEVIVITGYPSVDTAKESIRLGANDYLAKPLAPGEVIEAANRAMTQKHWALRFEASGNKVARVAACAAG
jgi:DNA-binding NtrC family response regulator